MKKLIDRIPEKKTKLISIRVEPTLFSEVKKRLKKDKLKVTDLITAAFRLYLDQGVGNG